ncbi:MAG TPA: hypothetical protein PKC65_03095 [Pyrinomonadaceae bacterium]|nr:hypothetical protein [Pyrinomonadaceae bacterium]
MTYDELLERVEIALNANDAKTAIKLCDSFILANPSSPAGYKKRSGVHARLENFSCAITDISEAIRLSSKEADYYFFRGWWKFESGDLDGAIEDQSVAINLEAHSLEKVVTESAFFFRALARLELGDYKSALLDVERVPDDFLIYLRRTGEITKSELIKLAKKSLDSDRGQNDFRQ